MSDERREDGSGRPWVGSETCEECGCELMDHECAEGICEDCSAGIAEADEP